MSAYNSRRNTNGTSLHKISRKIPPDTPVSTPATEDTTKPCPISIAICLLFFAFSTIIGWYFFGEANVKYVPQLSYPFVCWWTSRLLPCPGYYKQCCDEHWGYTCLFWFWFPQCVCPAVGLLGHMAVLFPVFKEISSLFSIVAELVCIPTNSVREFPFLHTLSSIYCL